MADFTASIECLADTQIDFVLVGGLAAVTQGSSMDTHDIDICCDFSPDNLLRIQSARENLHPSHRMTTNRLPLKLAKENCTTLKHLYLDTDWGQPTAWGKFWDLEISMP